MMKLCYVAATALLLISCASAVKKHMPNSQDIEDAWERLVNPLVPATREETCLKTCCRDGGGQDCIDACGCKGRSCPQKFNNCGEKCQYGAHCGGTCDDCIGGVCRNDPLKNATTPGLNEEKPAYKCGDLQHNTKETCDAAPNCSWCTSTIITIYCVDLDYAKTLNRNIAQCDKV